MKVIFSHGKESGPWGSKIQYLASIAEQQGLVVESQDYTDILDPDLRVERLVRHLLVQQEAVILVGSSMGGYVSLLAAQEVQTQGLFLIAPAVYMRDEVQEQYAPKPTYIEVVHGWSDEVIPVKHAIRFAREADCYLHAIAGDHRLLENLSQLGEIFSTFLMRLQR